MHDLSPLEPVNIIYTGVAGTGKTYQLLQIAKHYTDYLPSVDNEQLLQQVLQDMSWREVICLIFLDLQADQQDLVKVPQIVSHEFFIAKAAQNAREKNLSNTAWSVLQMHSPVDSKTVSCDNRSSQAYFDKDETGAWYLLSSSSALLPELSQQLGELKQAQDHNKTRHNRGFDKQRFSMVSFHQAYGYEEFVEGIRPVMGASTQTQMSYDIQDGAFIKLCQRAAQDPEHRYGMLIDEINRANVSRVFGELLSLIEPDKRAGSPNAMTIELAYSGRSFSVPANVDIYATMNTQDHSLAPLDMALRRRFRFIDCPPRPELLSIIDVNQESKTSHASESIDLAKLLQGMNTRIIQTLGMEAQLGHAFLLSVQNITQLQSALIEQIIPQLAQAASGEVAILQYIFRDEQQPLSAQFIVDSQNTNEGLNESLKTNAATQMFASQQSFVAQPLSGGGYHINADLLAKTGEFDKPSLYQRLYG